jgi:hypothetical protein
VTTKSQAVLSFDEMEEEQRFISVFKAAYGYLPVSFHLFLYEAMDPEAKQDTWDEMVSIGTSKGRIQ